MRGWRWSSSCVDGSDAAVANKRTTAAIDFPPLPPPCRFPPKAGAGRQTDVGTLLLFHLQGYRVRHEWLLSPK